MRILKLVGLSEDGKELVLTDADTGDDFAVPMDERLRAAVVHDRVRLGQLELAFSSNLRPKEIQARVRAGESTEQVAAAAGIPVERALRFAAPVLAEREHIATQARRSVLRRPGAESPKALAEAVAERLNQRGVPPTELAWDAWRRDDGKWTVSASYRSGERARRALFVYDPLSRVVLPSDDESRWLAGEPGPLHGPQPRTPRPPLRLAATADGDQPDHARDAGDAGEDDAGGHPGLFDHQAGPDEQSTVELQPVSLEPMPVQAPASEPANGDGPDDLAADEFADFDDEPSEPPAAEAEAEPAQPSEPTAAQPAAAQPAEPEPASTPREPAEREPGERKPAPKKQAGKKPGKRRAAVPSWDDILFGAKNNAD